MTAPEFAEHYAACSPEVVARLQQIEDLVHSLVPDLVSKIAYGIPTVTLRGKNFVHWAGYESHVGFYPGPATVAEFVPRFGTRKHAKGSVQFPNDEPLPLDLIEAMVRHRLTV